MSKSELIHEYFMLKSSKQEFENLKSQFVNSSSNWQGTQYLSIVSSSDFSKSNVEKLYREQFVRLLDTNFTHKIVKFTRSDNTFK